jgi:glycosyltransferase involved in cell wall biosynthesis
MTVRVGVVIATDERGGAEHHLLRLYSGLTRYGVEGHLIGRLPGWPGTGLRSTPTSLGPKWSRRSAARSAARAPVERRRVLQQVRELHRRDPFDLFHVQFKREQVLLTRALAELAPVVWTEHGTLPVGPGSRALRAAYRRAARSARTIVCVSGAVAADVSGACGAAAPVQVVANAVDGSRFRPPRDPAERRDARCALGLDPHTLTVGVVSRLHRRKRIERLLDALPVIDDLTLVVAGDGPERDRLERRALGRGLRDARFTGWVDEPERFYRAVDAVFVPAAATGEGAPTTAMLEAASSGCALIAVDGDEVANAVRDSGGLVLPSGAALDVDRLRTGLTGARASAGRWAAGFGVEPWLRRHVEVFDDAGD